MTNQVNSFNAELTELESAITLLTAQLNKDNKTETNTNQAKQDFYMSQENQDAMMIVGNEINRLFAIANDGVSKEDHIKETKKDPSFKKAKYVTGSVIKNHGATISLDRKELKQRYSEYSMFALFKNDFVKTANEIIDSGKYCTANQKVISKMTKDEIYPYPMVAPEIKDAAWIVDQMEKLCDKHDVKQTDVVSKLILTNFKMVQSTIARYEQQQKLVKDMGKTKLDKTKYDTSLSLDNLSKPSEKISA